jgi:hypothetical protein
MAVSVKCPEHGITLARMHREEESVFVRFITACGCQSGEFVAGTDAWAHCSEHGTAAIVFTNLCRGCGTHGSALLECGCQGGIVIENHVSVFHRED